MPKKSCNGSNEREVGDFGDMLKHDLEKSHQDCERFRQQVARLPCPTKQAEKVSASTRRCLTILKPSKRSKIQWSVQSGHYKMEIKQKSPTRIRSFSEARDVARTGNMTSMQLGGAVIPFNAYAKTKQEKREEESS